MSGLSEAEQIVEFIRNLKDCNGVPQIPYLEKGTNREVLKWLITHQVYAERVETMQKLGMRSTADMIVAVEELSRLVEQVQMTSHLEGSDIDGVCQLQTRISQLVKDLVVIYEFSSHKDELLRE